MIGVNCQTDELCSSISSNQCSWCAAEFISKKEKLIYFFFNDEEEFRKLYRECLLEGSRKRKEFGTLLYGENVDNKTLLSKYNFDIIYSNTILCNEDEKFLNILPDSLKDEFYSRIYINTSINNLKFETNLSILISRHGQSFSVLKVVDKFLVLDSHIHEAKIMTLEELKKYIVSDDSGHTHVTLLSVC